MDSTSIHEPASSSSSTASAATPSDWLEPERGEGSVIADAPKETQNYRSQDEKAVVLKKRQEVRLLQKKLQNLEKELQKRIEELLELRDEQWLEKRGCLHEGSSSVLSEQHGEDRAHDHV